MQAFCTIPFEDLIEKSDELEQVPGGPRIPPAGAISCLYK